MQASPLPILTEIPRLESYPYQVILPARFGDLAPSGTIEHIGMARCYEDARGWFMQEVCDRHGFDRALWRSFIVRAINEQLGPVEYPEPIHIGLAVIAVGSSSSTVELAAFQGDACVGRSRAIAAAVGADHAPAPLPEALRAILAAGRVERPGWSAPARPGPERRRLSHYSHSLTLPTRFSDTDAIGHLNNVALLRYADEGRAACVLEARGALAGREARTPRPEPGWAGTVVRADISYLREARLGAPLTTTTAIRGIEGPHVLLEQALWQREECVAICDCTVAVPPDTAQHLREHAAPR